MFRMPPLARNVSYAFCLGLSVLIALSQLPWTADQPVAAADVQISRDQFAQYVADWSEPEGYFDSDNFISNETSYLHIVDELRSQVRPGGVYLGVGPDQNFSYIVHTQPSLAIIVDIRRQNMLEHLIYKALFALSTSRAEFLAMLFSTETPRLDGRTSLPEVLRAIRSAETSNSRFETNLANIKLRLADYGLGLNDDDFAKIDYVYNTFHQEGMDLRFSSIGRGNADRYPTYEQLMLEPDLSGRLQNYLSTEELFLWMKKFQAENRLIPIVGDFSGSHAFKTMGAFLSRNGLQVSAFYTSNVEFYLFGRPVWPLYVGNVSALPMSDDAVFIRAYFSSSGFAHPKNVPGHRSTTLVQDVAAFRANQLAGRIRSYWDVVRP